MLAGASDADGDPLTATLVSGPGDGTLTLKPDGSFTYTPAAGFFGSDAFTYVASDGLAISNVATVSLDVTEAAPQATNDSYTVSRNGVLSVPQGQAGVLANDTDADGDALTATRVDLPTHGSLTLEPSGAFFYTPNPGYVGSDTFTYQASDGLLAVTSPP